MSQRRLAAAAAALGALASASVAPALAQRLIVPTSADARLAGPFQMTGRIYEVNAVVGEHKGEIVHRNWTFTPGCATGACPTIKLTRHRAHGVDHLVLTRRSPGYYTGNGSFFAPLRCAGTVWRHGAKVPFGITVRVTSSAVVNGVVVATAVRAYYHNTVRFNQTPCVVSTLGHDDAAYTGVPAGAAARTRLAR
jgi:hypothetical protein